MKKNELSQPGVKQHMQADMVLYVYVFSVREWKPLAIEQEKVNQSSIAANKKEPFKNVWRVGTVNN